VRVTKTYRSGAIEGFSKPMFTSRRLPAWDRSATGSVGALRPITKRRQAGSASGGGAARHQARGRSRGEAGANGERIVPPGNVRWVANRSKYFIAAVIPDSGTVSDVVFRGAGGGLVTAWFLGTAAPGAEVARHSRVYAGPIHYETLEAVGSGLDEVANLGWQWMRGISVLLLKCLNLLHKVIPNYGIAIIILAAATKFLFYPLTQSSLRSMKVMHHLQPQIKELQDRHKGDPMKLNQAMMALYKENKVNPMSGCLPMLLQAPSSSRSTTCSCSPLSFARPRSSAISATSRPRTSLPPSPGFRSTSCRS